VREGCGSEHIDPIDRALTRINTLIDDLLTLAREGDRVNDTEPVGLADLSAECWRTVETADATIHTHIDRTVQADRSRLAQLLENLFRNAVEHGSTSPASQAQQDAVEHGGGDVTITVGELDDGFYVEDDGPGIPEGERTDVFDAGYSTGEGGTGLGLSICTQVAEAHGWDIRVTEGSDGGARFEITRQLPLVQGQKHPASIINQILNIQTADSYYISDTSYESPLPCGCPPRVAPQHTVRFVRIVVTMLSTFFRVRELHTPTWKFDNSS